MLNMRVKASVLINVFVLQCLWFLCSSQDFDFFYLVLQWPPSYCDTGCCYPTIGKPDEDFTIHGLWPNYKNGTWPQYCDPVTSLNETQISDLISRMQKDWPTLACPSANGTSFWNHEWERHGTCSSLDQHSYFEAALDLKDKSNLLQILNDAEIKPGNFYSNETIKQAVEEGIGYEPFLECNNDSSGNCQLYQVYLCVDISAKNFIECPIFPSVRSCNSSTEFPSFSSDSESHGGYLTNVDQLIQFS